MACKLFLIIVLFLLVGEVTGQMSDENVKYLSKLYNIPAEELQYVNVPEREKRWVHGVLLGARVIKKVINKIRRRHRNG